MKTASLIFMVIGLLIFLVGLYMNFMKWPDLFDGTISGPILLGFGVVIFIIYQIRKK